MKSPPRFARLCLKLLVRDYEHEALIGDFDELYKNYAHDFGLLRANLWYWCQICMAVPAIIRNSVFWSVFMFKNYLITALRNMKRYKGYSFINIAGLAIAMACCIVILLFVQEELSYDKFHENAKHIYRIATEWTDDMERSTKTWSWMAPNMIADFPEVTDTVRLYRYGGVISCGEKYFSEAFFFADPSLLEIFSFRLIKGNKEAILKNPENVFLTEELANKFLGEEDPLGKILIIDGIHTFKIAGVLENVPNNSHFTFDLLAPFERLKDILGSEEFQEGILVRTYLLLDKNTPYKELEKKLHDFAVKYKGENFASKHNFFLQPLTSIHLHSHLAVELRKNSDIGYSYALSLIALIILLTACVNFMNLSTARASSRSKEVGMRKVIGAHRFQLFRQFLSESFILSFIAMLFAIALAHLIMPFFNSIMGKDLIINLKENYVLYFGLVLLTFFVGFISGSYPAIFLSSYQPVEVIRGNYRKSTKMGLLLKKGLIVFQFAISIIFIVGTIIVFRQVNFINKKNLGFDKESIVKLHLDNTLRRQYETVISELLKNPNITGATASLVTPGGESGLSVPFVFEDVPDKETILDLSYVDYSFFKFFGVEIVEGRGFSKNISSDASSAFILNEAAAKKLGKVSPISRQIKCEGFGLNGRIIGIVKDFHNVSLHEEIKPSIFMINPPNYFSLFARIRPKDIQGTISFIEKKMREFSPKLNFSYSFLDEFIANIYREEKKMSQVFGFSSILSIIIACLGLFGLTSFSVGQRIKEIGIRKVLGANVSNVFFLLSKDFIKLILIATILAWPVAYIGMNIWLQTFAYRINIGIGTFLFSAFLALIIAWMTVSYQALKTATTDPVDSLRYE